MAGQRRETGMTVGTTAPTGPVRGLFCPRPWAGPWPSVGGSPTVGGPLGPRNLTAKNGPLAANSRLGGPFLCAGGPAGRSVRSVGCFTDDHGRDAAAARFPVGAPKAPTWRSAGGVRRERRAAQDSLGSVANGSATDLLKETIGGASFQAGTPCSGLATGYLSSLISAQCEWFIWCRVKQAFNAL